MKRFSVILALVVVGLLSTPSFALPKGEAVFKRVWKKLLGKFDKNKDGEISKSEVQEVLATEKAKKAEKTETPKTGTANVNSATHHEVAMVVHKFVKDFDQIANAEGVVTEAAFKTWFEQLATELKDKKASGTTPSTPSPSTTPESTPPPAPSSDDK